MIWCCARIMLATEIKDCSLAREDLGEAGGRENMMEMYSMKKFNKK